MLGIIATTETDALVKCPVVAILAAGHNVLLQVTVQVGREGISSVVGAQTLVVSSATPVGIITGNSSPAHGSARRGSPAKKSLTAHVQAVLKVCAQYPHIVRGIPIIETISRITLRPVRVPIGTGILQLWPGDGEEGRNVNFVFVIAKWGERAVGIALSE